MEVYAAAARIAGADEPARVVPHIMPVVAGVGLSIRHQPSESVELHGALVRAARVRPCNRDRLAHGIVFDGGDDGIGGGIFDLLNDSGATPVPVELHAPERLCVDSSRLELLRVAGFDREREVAGAHRFQREAGAALLDGGLATETVVADFEKRVIRGNRYEVRFIRRDDGIGGGRPGTANERRLACKIGLPPAVRAPSRCCSPDRRRQWSRPDYSRGLPTGCSFRVRPCAAHRRNLQAFRRCRRWSRPERASGCPPRRLDRAGRARWAVRSDRDGSR